MVEEEGETAVGDSQLIAYADILHVLQRARADIEGLIAVAGTDQAEMLADNYDGQWETLGMLAEASRRLELELAQSAI